MEDDDMMLNISMPTKPIAPKTQSQSAQKKQKYTITFKKNNKDKKKSNEFNYNLLPEPTTEKTKEESTVKQERGKTDSDAKFKRPRDFQREDKNDNKKMRGDKRVKREERSYPRQDQPNLIKPSTVNAVTPA